MQVKKTVAILQIVALTATQLLAGIELASAAPTQADRKPAGAAEDEVAIEGHVVRYDEAACNLDGKKNDGIVKVQDGNEKNVQTVNCVVANRVANNLKSRRATASSGDCVGTSAECGGGMAAETEKRAKDILSVASRASNEEACRKGPDEFIKTWTEAGNDCLTDLACSAYRGIATVYRSYKNGSAFAGRVLGVKSKQNLDSVEKEANSSKCTDSTRTDMFSEATAALVFLPVMAYNLGAAGTSALGDWSGVTATFGDTKAKLDVNGLEDTTSGKGHVGRPTPASEANNQQAQTQSMIKSAMKFGIEMLAQVTADQVVCIKWKSETPRQAWMQKDLNYCEERLTKQNWYCTACDALLPAIGAAMGNVAMGVGTSMAGARVAGRAVGLGVRGLENAGAKMTVKKVGAKKIAAEIGEKAAESLPARQGLLFGATGEFAEQAAKAGAGETVKKGGKTYQYFLTRAEHFSQNPLVEAASKVAAGSAKATGKVLSVPGRAIMSYINIGDDLVTKQWRAGLNKSLGRETIRKLPVPGVIPAYRNAAEMIAADQAITAGRVASNGVGDAADLAYSRGQLNYLGEQLDKIGKESEELVTGTPRNIAAMEPVSKIKDTTAVENFISELERCQTAECHSWMLGYFRDAKKPYLSRRAVARALARMENPPLDEITKLLFDPSSTLNQAADFRLARVLSEILADTDPNRISDDLVKQVNAALAKHKNMDKGVAADLVRLMRRKDSSFNPPGDLDKDILAAAKAEADFEDRIGAEMIKFKIEKGADGTKTVHELLDRIKEQQGNKAAVDALESAGKVCTNQAAR